MYDSAALLPLAVLAEAANTVSELDASRVPRDIYAAANYPHVFVPAAAHLVDPVLDVERVRTRNGVVVEARGGFVRGVDVEGREWRAGVAALRDQGAELRVELGRGATGLDAAKARMTVYEEARLVGGKLFAGYLAARLRRYGVIFKRTNRIFEVEVIVGEEPYAKRMVVRTRVYEASVNGRVYRVPSVVAGLITLLANGEVETGVFAEAREYLRELLEFSRDYAPTAMVLKHASRTKFVYTVGRAEGEGIVYRLDARDHSVYLATEDGRLDLIVKYWVPPKPSKLVLGVPALSLLPLAATLREVRLETLVEEVTRGAEKKGVKVHELRLPEVADLANIPVSHRDIARFLWRGYPRREDVERLVDAVEAGAPLDEELAAYIIHGGVVRVGAEVREAQV